MPRLALLGAAALAAPALGCLLEELSGADAASSLQLRRRQQRRCTAAGGRYGTASADILHDLRAWAEAGVAAARIFTEQVDARGAAGEFLPLSFGACLDASRPECAEASGRAALEVLWGFVSRRTGTRGLATIGPLPSLRLTWDQPLPGDCFGTPERQHLCCCTHGSEAACFSDNLGREECCEPDMCESVAGGPDGKGRVASVAAFRGNIDDGWLEPSERYGSLWWVDPSNPKAFTLFDLDGLYPEAYFEEKVAPDQAREIVRRQRQAFSMLSGRELLSVAELGAGGGWFTEAFAEAGLDYQSLEGSAAGVRRTRDRPGVDPARVHRGDLRLPQTLPPPLDGGSGRFDLAMCTEVAEHVELPFLSQLVATLAAHADLIWFSFAPPEAHRPHVHHSSELPLRMWLNLFEFHGYGAVLLSDEDVGRLSHRGRLLFYRRTPGESEPLQARLAALALPRVRVPGAVADALLLPSLFTGEAGRPPPELG